MTTYQPASAASGPAAVPGSVAVSVEVHCGNCRYGLSAGAHAPLTIEHPEAVVTAETAAAVNAARAARRAAATRSEEVVAAYQYDLAALRAARDDAVEAVGRLDNLYVAAGGDAVEALGLAVHSLDIAIGQTERDHTRALQQMHAAFATLNGVTA